MAGLLVIYLRFEHGYRYVYGLAPLFDPAREANGPTWFSSAVLLLTAGAFALAGLRLRAAGSPGARWWLVLARRLPRLAGRDREPARAAEPAGAARVQRGLRPGVGADRRPPALVFLAVSARFVRRLQPRVRSPLVLGAALFVGGALGIEVVEIVLERRGSGALPVALTMLGQEAMEMLGAVVLLHAALTNLPPQ